MNEVGLLIEVPTSFSSIKNLAKRNFKKCLILRGIHQKKLGVPARFFNFTLLIFYHFLYVFLIRKCCVFMKN